MERNIIESTFKAEEEKLQNKLRHNYETFIAMSQHDTILEKATTLMKEKYQNYKHRPPPGRITLKHHSEYIPAMSRTHVRDQMRGNPNRFTENTERERVDLDRRAMQLQQAAKETAHGLNALQAS
jgi:hypothetical protein